MNAAVATDEIKCKAFPIFLEDMALVWFIRLPAWSISSFRELSEKFVNQFRLHAQRSKIVIELSLIKQRPDESLRSYLDHFNLAVTEVKDPHEQTVLMALIDGVDKDTEFGRYLAGKPPPTREIFYEKPNVRLHWEEIYANQKRKATDKEDIQSNVAIKQMGDSLGKVEVNVGNKNQGNSRQSGNNNNNRKETEEMTLRGDPDLDCLRTSHR